MDLKKKNILYLVHNYNSFQKDSIEVAAKSFNKVYVLVRYKPISSFIKYLPFKNLKKYKEEFCIDTKYTPSNVEVIKTPVLYLPFGFLYKLLGKLHLSAVLKVIKKNNIKFDIIHCHFLWSSGYVGMMLKKEYNKPLVLTGHGYDVYSLPFKNSFWKKNIKEILLSADSIITVSNKNRDLLLELGACKKKVALIYNGYNSKIFKYADKYESRKALGIKSNAKILLNIGNLEEVKGHKYLIEAISFLKKEKPNIYCYIVGGGSLIFELEKLVEKFHLEKNIIFLGPKKHEDISIWLNACDLFVMPSISEGLPISMLEALGCGKPFVGSSVGGIPEIIVSEDYGILVKPRDSKGLVRTINKAFKKEWDYEKIAEYGKEFTWEEVNKKIVNIYSKVLNE